METNPARSQLCLPYKRRGVAAIILIRQISTHVSRSQRQAKDPWALLRVSTLNERSCRLNSLSKRHVVIRPSQPFQGNSGQCVACKTCCSPHMLGSNKRLLSALRRVRVAQLPVPTRYANARMRKNRLLASSRDTLQGKSPKERLLGRVMVPRV